jgi:F-box interacting protein
MASGTEETTTKTLPILPFDLLIEILCRLPVKLLLQLRCLCKSFNSLIIDPKFAKKHLRLSTTHHLTVSTTNNLGQLLLLDFPKPSDFSTSTVTYPDCLKNGHCPFRVRSCDGILCLTMYDNGPAVLWNPSIRTFKILPPLDNKRFSAYSIGYDHCINNYKIVACSQDIGKTEVSVHTLGTDSWKRIQDFPYSAPFGGLGIFVSGTINWLAKDDVSSLHVIISLDLEESYQKLPLPDSEKYPSTTLGVLRDCLCISRNSTFVFLDVWIMKEYGNKDSWTNLYRVLHMKDQVLCRYPKALYIFEDEQQLLMGCFEPQGFGSYKLKLVAYDSKNSTLEISEIQNISSHRMELHPQVYIESLISPCS